MDSKVFFFTSVITVWSIFGSTTDGLFGEEYPHGDLGIKHKCAGDCLVLRDRIISQIDDTVNPCDDIHSYMCRNKDYDRTKRKVDVPKMLNQIKDILASPIEMNAFHSLNIERRLYMSCLRLGDEYHQEQEELAFETLYRQIRDYLKYDDNWHDLDDRLNSLGFGHSFFDIRVADDYEGRGKIIVLQPPKVSRLWNLVQRTQNVVNLIYHQQNRTKDKGKVNDINDLYGTVKKNLEGPIQKFFKDLLQIRVINTQKYTEKLKNARMTIHNLDTFYTQLSEFAGFSKIEWDRIIQRTFRRVGVMVVDTDHLVIVNRPYFTELAKLLKVTSNHVIVSAMWAKIITESLAYINWEQTKSLESIINKSTYCLMETKLYGASHKLMYQYVNEDSNTVTIFREMEEILANVLQVMSLEISRSFILSHPERKYLQNKVRSITKDVFDKVFDSNPYFYAEFNFTDSYFFNIIKYRQLNRDQELRSLRDTTYQRPFSIAELIEPRNRFIFNVLFDNARYLSADSPSIMNYGSYGVKIAGFLYSLMYENPFKDEGSYEHTSDYRFSHPEYPSDYTACFQNFSYTHEQITGAITDVFGLRIAYRAMTAISSTKKFESSFHVTSLDHALTEDQVFIMTFARSCCNVNSRALQRIVSRSGLMANFFCAITDQISELQCNFGFFRTLDRLFLVQV
ncbi:hypothetical protein QAD02_008577 [Eretmocerus hayati]|uniref:Uncharacterized protein n=1 Tax=Eretmocerus hayati TaxID=131215 RepID=A0ACC2NBB8_9HYME|nr:hypothetical protein QAD02_008577 [Eretmocerus hayati]